MSTITTRLAGRLPRRRTAFFWLAVLNTELLAVLVYLGVANVTITDPLILVYPFLWINVGALAVARTTPPVADRRHRLLGGLIGAGYFLVLSVAGGLIGPGHLLLGGEYPDAFRIAWGLPPGWAPAVLYQGALAQLAIIPYKLVGYLALSYLVYVTVLDAAGSAVSGLVGVFSCVSCTWPVLGTVLTGVFGSSSAVVAAVTNQPYAASTVVFLSAVGLLYWRPGFR